MNTKIISTVISTVILAWGLVFSVHRLHGQIAPYGIYNGGPVQSAQPETSDSIVQLTADAQGLSWLAPDQVPFSGTFWTIVPGSDLGMSMALPYPCPPPGQLPTYALPGGSFLVDDTATTNIVTQAQLEAQATAVVNLVSQGEATVANAQPHALARDTFDGAPSPGSGTGGGTYTPDVYTNSPINYGANLWLEITSLSNVWVNLLVSNTVADVKYEIDGTTNLARGGWNFETFIYGSELTNWTPATINAFNRTNNLFLRVKSWADDGSGLPIWWQLEYFGYVGGDPSGDPAGDGWSNIQKFQSGWNPTNFYTPPAPVSSLSYDGNNNIVTVSWLPAPGPVTNYRVTRIDWDTAQTANFNFTPPTVSFQDNLTTEIENEIAVSGNPYISVEYDVEAEYAGGVSTASVTNVAYIPAPDLVFANGSDGRGVFVFPVLPTDLSYVNIYRVAVEYQIGETDFSPDDYDGPLIADGFFQVPAAKITNGVCPLPDSQLPFFLLASFFVQTVRSNGVASGWDFVNGETESTPFVDVRTQLKDNLRYLLRAAGPSGPPAYGTANNYLAYAFPLTYLYSGFYSSGQTYYGLAGGDFDPLRPVFDNCFYRNFVFNSGHLDPFGFLDTGCYYGGYPIGYNDSSFLFVSNTPTYFFDQAEFLASTNLSVPASLLATSQTTWILQANDFGNYAAAQNNYYGLPYVSLKDAYVTNDLLTVSTFSPGESVPDGNYYSQTAEPDLQLTGYYFARTFPDPMPEENGFSPTNTTPLMILGVGNPVKIAGYAKFSILNGDSAVPCYLGQNFEHAYQIDTNGNATANTTGILSPYGDYFPTEPGAAALVTMPDIDTGQRGTCTVYTVSLQLDANHDGVMDTSFSGKDATSYSNPMQFWANNNYDRNVTDKDDGVQYDDDVGATTYAAMSPGTPGVPTPDCNFLDGAGNRAIPTARDLQDFTRLRVCGITSNLLSALPAESTITLNWGDVGNPNPGNPTIDLFQAEDANGGIGYLTNYTTSLVQLLEPYMGRLAPGSNLVLNASTFANHWAGNHFIWCGVSNGTGGLNLTIKDGSGNVLAQTTAYIQIQDIKQMYERWTLGDQLSTAPLTNAVPATEGLPVGASAFQYAAPQNTNTPYILYVHGWNMEAWEKDRFAESAFKRLYWQGYQGRFGLFRWPTGNGFAGWATIASNPVEKDNFDSSERNAWLSGRGLLNKLNDLGAKYPGHVYMLAHSMGNVVAGEALRLAGNNQVVKTYVASQAAISAHTYDPSVPSYSFWYPPASAAPETPNIYGNWFAGNNGGGAGHVFSFHNTNDFALQRSVWQLNELLKPDQDVLEGLTVWDYAYGGSINDPAPWNKFYKYNIVFPLQSVSFDIVNVLTNRYEVMALAAQPYTTALGATPGILNNISQNIDLMQIWPPDLVHPNHPFDEHFYHSAEFRGDYWQQQGYWSELLGINAFNLQ